MPTLHWLTRDEDIHAVQKIAYRLLESVSDLSAGKSEIGNMLIRGGNPDADCWPTP